MLLAILSQQLLLLPQLLRFIRHCKPVVQPAVRLLWYLVVYVELVYMTSVDEQAHKLCFYRHMHALKLPGLMVAAFIAVK